MFDFLGGKKLSQGLSAIGMYADGVCLVRAQIEGGRRPRLNAWDFRPIKPDQPADKVLAGLARDHDLKHARCTTALDENDYKLLLTEAPDVARDELKAAVRWRIKDLIDFHINDATLDVFDLPGAETGVKAREMYVVAARNQAIQKRVDLLDAAGINLDVIDIQELAQRNIAALLPEDVNGVAVLSLQEHSGLITITRQGQLYLSRTLATGVQDMAGGSDIYGYFDQIVLEVQRSLDYFESHFRQAPIRHLALAPLSREMPDLPSYLATNLNIATSVIDLAQLLDCSREFPAAWQAKCFGTVGAALRQEVRAL